MYFPFLCTRKFPPERDRKGSPLSNDERYEGIRRYEDVSGGRFKLKSALAEYKEERQADSGYFKIGFYVDESIESKDIDILLEDRKGKLYYMIPVRKQWSNGFQEFRWDNDFADSHEVKLYDLYAKAEVKEPGLVSRIVPIVLYYSAKPDRVEKYKFIFVCNRQVTVQYTIYDEQGNEKDSGLRRRKPKDTEIVITWNCEDAPSGRYQLLVEYTFIGGRVESSTFHRI